MLKQLKKIVFLTSIPLVMASFSQCGSAQYVLEDQVPPEIDLQGAYYQVTPPGIKEGDTQVRVHIPVTKDNISLDKLYFRGQVSTLTQAKDAYVANFVERSKETPITLGEETKQEKSAESEKLPFDLKYGECIISYTKGGGETKYVKVDELTRKPNINVPMSPKGGGLKQEMKKN